MVDKITKALEKAGYFDISFDYEKDNSYYFEAYSDAPQEVRVDIEGNTLSIYDRYFEDKHFVLMDAVFLVS
jgi:hypothetical protein